LRDRPLAPDQQPVKPVEDDAAGKIRLQIVHVV
jgi:hypothetical protein